MSALDETHNILTRSFKDNGAYGPKDTIYKDTTFDKLLGVIDNIISMYKNPANPDPYSPGAILATVHRYFMIKQLDPSVDANIDIYFNNKFNYIKYQLYYLTNIASNRQEIINARLAILDKDLNSNRNKLEKGILTMNPTGIPSLVDPTGKIHSTVLRNILNKHVVIDIDIANWEFEDLFAENIKKTSSNLNFTFINKNGKLYKMNKDGSEEPYTYEALKATKKIQDIVKKFCVNTDMNTADCTNFMSKCAFGKDKAQECQNFMTTLAKPEFMKNITNLDHIDPMIINRVVVSFDWPQVWNPKLKVNELKAVRDWLNPEKYSDAKDKANIKLLVENLNLLAFFDAIKSTTDAFPAILNPGHSGSSHGENTFERNVRLSQFGLASIKPYRYTGALKINASENMLLQTKKIVNDYYARSAIRFGIELAPNMGGVTLRALSGMRGGAVDIVEQEVARMKEVAGGPEYVYTADILTKLWERLTSDLADNHGMDVQNMKNEVNAYLNQLSTLQEKTLYAIAYVQVFTEQLQQREQDNEPLESNVLTVANLKELVEARNKLIKKNFGKDMNLFDMLQQILVKLKNKN